MRYRNYIFLLVAIILFSIYYVDIPLAVFIKNSVGETVEKIFEVITDFGSFTYIVAINIIILAYLFAKYRMGEKTKIMLIGGLAQSISAIIIQILKFVFGRVRPFHYLSDSYSSSTFTFFTFQEQYKSFPSGHSAGIWALITCLLLVFKDNKYAKLLIIPGIIVSISRLILDMHYFSDILAGAVLGIVITAAVMGLLRKNFL